MYLHMDEDTGVIAASHWPGSGLEVHTIVHDVVTWSIAARLSTCETPARPRASASKSRSTCPAR
jgi:hypothetical protein